MTSRDFCYWLQGYFEIASKVPMPPEPLNGYGLNSDQLECVRRHLALVFKHEIDPSAGPLAHQKELDAIHHDHDPKWPEKIGGVDPLRGLVFRC